MSTDTHEVDEESTALAVKALENEASFCATERRALNTIISNKLNLKQCCESERLEHNRLITQELHADNERMKLLVLMHRSKVRDIRYYKVG
jgi:hypothetical protein